MDKPRHILLIITGSVAAYKALELIRLLGKRGIGVRTVMTEGAQQFITPLAVASLSSEAVYTELFSLKDEREMGHIRLSREAELVVVAPASADMIARMAQGRADDLAAATLLASNKPLLVVPAMNTQMWQHPATRRNIAQIVADGAEVVAPENGVLACGEEGAGRMAEPDALAQLIAAKLGLPNTGFR